MLLLLFAQAVAELPVDRPGPPAPNACQIEAHKPDEVVVCAPRPKARSPYRIDVPRSQQQQEGLGKAEVALGDGVSASAETETADVGGFPSKRAMIRLKIGF